MTQKSSTEGTFEFGSGSGAGEWPAMPLRIIVAAELGARDLRTGQATERRQKVRIDRQSFDEVMAGFGIRAFLDVPDRLSGGKAPLLVELELPDLKAFRPDALAGQIPATRDLLELRSALVDLRSAKRKLEDVKQLAASLENRSAVLDSVRRALEGGPEPPPAPTLAAAAPETGGGVEALLDMVEAPSGSTAGRGADLSRLDALVRQLVRTQNQDARVDAKAVQAAIGEIDAALAAQIDEVMHHAELQRLESTWRGLRLLTDRTDFEHPILIELISCGRESLISVYDELVHEPESQGISETPVSLVVVDQVFENTADDIELLRGLAERGSALSAVVLANAGNSLLGLSKAGELAKKPGLKTTFEGEAFTKWRGLREYVHARWLGLAFNRVLLRAAYGEEGMKARKFEYVERVADGEVDLHLWGNAVWYVASLATRSFARIGWCTDIMGQRASGMIEDLPVRRYERPGAEEVSFPLETAVGDAVERDLSQAGIMALTAALNSDRAFLRFAPSVHSPGHYQDPMDLARARLQSTLPYQLFVSRIINYAMLIEGRVVSGRSPEQVSAGYDQALRGLMASAGAVPEDAVQVGVVPNADDPSQQVLHMRITWPGFKSLPDAGRLELTWPLQG